MERACRRLLDDLCQQQSSCKTRFLTACLGRTRAAHRVAILAGQYLEQRFGPKGAEYLAALSVMTALLDKVRTLHGLCYIILHSF